MESQPNTADATTTSSPQAATPTATEAATADSRIAREPRRSIPWATLAAALAAVVFALLWLTAKSEADDARSELDSIRAEEKAEADAAAELPNLKELAAKYRMTSQGAVESASETSLSLNFYGSSAVALSDLERLLDDLGFSDATMSRIENTRALDGTLSASAPHAEATWTYHPDDGLSIVIERTA